MVRRDRDVFDLVCFTEVSKFSRRKLTSIIGLGLNLIGGALAAKAQPLHDLTAFFYIFFHIWPLDIATHQTFNSSTSWVAEAEIFQDTLLEC